VSDRDPLAGTTCPAGHDGPLGEPGIMDEVHEMKDRALYDALKAAKPKRGRPKCSEEPCGAISVWLPVTAQDRIIRLAAQRRQSVSEYLRDVLLTLFVRK